MHGLRSSPPWSKYVSKFNQALTRLKMSPIVLPVVCGSHWACIASVPPRVRRAVTTPHEGLKIWQRVVRPKVSRERASHSEELDVVNVHVMRTKHHTFQLSHGVEGNLYTSEKS